MMYGGTIANSGLTGGVDLKTTVMPFILRGVKLLGIDSVACPQPQRVDVWRRLATDLRPAHLSTTAKIVSFEGQPGAFETLLAGRARGCYVVRLTE
jgi:acrylyl-CoA reductase (NADPH)